MWDSNFIQALKKMFTSWRNLEHVALDLDELLQKEKSFFEMAQKCYLAFRRYSSEAAIGYEIFNVALKKELDPPSSIVVGDFDHDFVVLLVAGKPGEFYFLVNGSTPVLEPLFRGLRAAKLNPKFVQKSNEGSLLRLDIPPSRVEELVRNLVMFKMLLGLRS